MVGFSQNCIHSDKVNGGGVGFQHHPNIALVQIVGPDDLIQLGLKQAVEAGRFSAGQRLVFVHTGGLQGRRGFEALL